MQWTPRLSIGHPGIDGQHRALVEALGRVTRALRDRAGPVEIERRLLALGDAVVAHFGDEEGVMREHAYPGYEVHRREHEALMRDFARLHADLFRASLAPAMASALEVRLGGWLVEHITGPDRELGAWLRDRCEPWAAERLEPDGAAR